MAEFWTLAVIEHMKRINPIEWGITGGIFIAVAILFVGDSLPSGSWTGSAMRFACWPEGIVVHGLGKIFFPNDQENIVIWLPVHFLYWGFIGGALAFICTRLFQRLHRPR